MIDKRDICISLILEGRKYELTIPAYKEEAYRKAIKHLNEQLKHFRQSSSNLDRIDILSKLAIDTTAEKYLLEVGQDDFIAEIEEINDNISDYLLEK